MLFLRKNGDAEVWTISILTWADETLRRIIQEIKQRTTALDNYSHTRHTLLQRDFWQSQQIQAGFQN